MAYILPSFLHTLLNPLRAPLICTILILMNDFSYWKIISHVKCANTEIEHIYL